MIIAVSELLVVAIVGNPVAIHQTRIAVANSVSDPLNIYRNLVIGQSKLTLRTGDVIHIGNYAEAVFYVSHFSEREISVVVSAKTRPRRTCFVVVVGS